MSQSIQTIQTISQDQTTVSAAAPGVATPAGFKGDEPAEDWQNYANCLGVDPDLFFPERGASTKEAKGVCQACVVREDCLEYALENSEKFGIWGGLSERERRRLRRARALARAAAAETRTA
jgi:WhiB family redox-sensing transcriptional regulator